MDLAAALLMMHMGEMKTEDDIADAKVPRNLDDLGRFSDASYGRDRMRGGKYADKGRKLDGRKLRVKRNWLLARNWTNLERRTANASVKSSEHS